MQLHKLDQNRDGRGLCCDRDGLFLGGHPLLRKDEHQNLEARSPAELQIVFDHLYGREADWDSCIRSVRLIANALNKGDMARATMTAVLMGLAEPASGVRNADTDGVMAKAGFDPDEPRDERGRWTTDGSGTGDSRTTRHDPRIQLADDAMSDAINDPVVEAARRAAAQRNPQTNETRDETAAAAHENLWEALGSRISDEVKAALARVGRAEVAESNANLAASKEEGNAIADLLRAFTDYHTGPWIFRGKHLQVPVVSAAPPFDESGALIGQGPYASGATRPGKNADWIDPLINLLSFGGAPAGSGLRLARPAAELLDGTEVSANAVERVFATTRGVAVNGSRAIDRASGYEIGVRNLYDRVPLSERGSETFVDGKKASGVADTTTIENGKSTAVDAKYVDDWSESLRNPASQGGRKPWAVTEQEQMLRQAKAYSSGFPGGVIYHTNSVDFAAYYTSVFRKAGITNFRFVITPVARLSKTMTKNAMEEIFGEDAFERQRKVAGTRPGEDATVRYVSFDECASVAELFHSVAWKIEPPLVKSGGVVLEGTRLELPDGRRFFAVVFHDDIEGWQKQIEQGAGELGQATARIVAGDVLISDGQSYPLSRCKIEFHDKVK